MAAYFPCSTKFFFYLFGRIKVKVKLQFYACNVISINLRRNLLVLKCCVFKLYMYLVYFLCHTSLYIIPVTVNMYSTFFLNIEILKLVWTNSILRLCFVNKKILLLQIYISFSFKFLARQAFIVNYHSDRFNEAYPKI